MPEDIPGGLSGKRKLRTKKREGVQRVSARSSAWFYADEEWLFEIAADSLAL